MAEVSVEPVAGLCDGSAGGASLCSAATAFGGMALASCSGVPASGSGRPVHFWRPVRRWRQRAGVGHAEQPSWWPRRASSWNRRR